MTNTIFRTIFGSRLYGTATPDSDTDYKGVFLPNAKSILLGLGPTNYTVNNRVMRKGEKSGPNDVEEQFFSLAHYLKLLVEGQTVALDMFFAPTPDKTSPGWLALVAHKDKLLNKQCAAALGYAKAQSYKYSLKGDRIKALEAVIGFLKTCGEPRVSDVLDALRTYCAGLDVRTSTHVDIKTGLKCETQITVCGKSFGENDSPATALSKLLPYLESFGSRARQAQTDGSDLKAMYHAVRVSAQTTELLLTGHITFPRPEAALLLQIRRGELSREAISELIEQGLVDVEAAQKKSKLPYESDENWINGFIEDTYRNVVVMHAR